jgi:diaminohydroxyphosphoribosylaminopyrimidine deaminase/5-amino-6-(5-phosphoribosylamino)uracil reductase
MFDEKDRHYMERALSLASAAVGLASPNPTVGCVLVRDQEIVGEGWHEYARVDHAETAALQAAAGRAAGATVYLTLEPCSHHGRTPPCAEALIAAGVRRVVVPLIDPNPKVAGLGIKMLRGAGIQVDIGLGAEQAKEVLEPFACHVTTGRPLVVAKVGMTLDGKIAAPRNDERWITSAEGRDFGQSLRLKLDAILVGAGTVLADDPELTYRGSSRKSPPLTRVILDSRLRTPLGATMFACSQAPILIFCTPDAPAQRRGELENAGAEVVSLPAGVHGVDLARVLDALGSRGMLGLLVEGGSAVHWSFLEAGLVDKFYFILAPMVLGGSAVAAVGGTGYATIGEAPRFKVRRSFFLGPDLAVETFPPFSRSILSPWKNQGVKGQREEKNTYNPLPPIP